MKQSLITLIFLIATGLNAQLNDISTFKFVWDTYPTAGHISGTQDYLHTHLVRWNDDKITYNTPIKLWSFNTEDDIPSELAGKENDLEPLLTNAIAEWNNNYEIKMEIDNNEDNGVWIGFSNNPEDFITPDGDYAAGVTRIPVFWNGYDEQFEMYELLDTSETLTIYNGLDVYFFSNNSSAPTWTTSTTPDNEKTMLGTVLLHELGHVLGMGHSDVAYPPRIMDRSYNPKVISPTLTDGDTSNASYHYRQLYEIDDTYIEGDVAFSPLPGTYDYGQSIKMTNLTSNNNLLIVYKREYSAVSSDDAKSKVPDITAENWNFVYSDDYYNPRTLSKKNHYYYFKAALYNNTYNIIVGPQVEGAYYCAGTVGIEDAIFFEPLLTSYQTNSHYSSGSSYYLNFIDANPVSGDPDYIVSWDNWKCYVNNGCEDILIMDSQSFYIPTLPNGYNWERDANNNVIARMEKSGTDNDSIHHSTSAQIKISGVPNNFVASGTIPVNTTWCGDITITGDITIPAGKQLTILTQRQKTVIKRHI